MRVILTLMGHITRGGGITPCSQFCKTGGLFFYPFVCQAQRICYNGCFGGDSYRSRARHNLVYILTIIIINKGEFFMKKSMFQCSVIRNAMLSLIFVTLANPVMAEDLAYKLYQESGMQSQLQSMSSAFDQGFKHYADAIPEKTLNDMIKMGQETFHEPTMGKIITAHLREKMSDDQIKKVLDWQSTDIAKKINKLEGAAATEEGQQKLMAYARQLATKQPEKAYVAQIQKLAVASKSIDLAVEIAANMQYSMGAGMAMATANGNAVNLDAIAAEIEKAKPKLQQQLSQYILVSMLYTYQGLSEQELNSYIDFVSSPLGSSFYTAMYSGMDEAFGKVGEKYGKALGVYFKQDAKPSKS